MLGKEIADRIETDHLIGVVHTGDIVDSGRRTYQWENFDLCLNSFIDLIPFYPVSGNHDIGKPDSRKGGDYTGYLQQPFLKRFSEEQTFEGGKMLYAVLNEGEMPILLLGIGYDMGKNRQQLEWIDEVMRSIRICRVFCLRTHIRCVRERCFGIANISKTILWQSIRTYGSYFAVMPEDFSAMKPLTMTTETE